MLCLSALVIILLKKLSVVPLWVAANECKTFSRASQIRKQTTRLNKTVKSAAAAVLDADPLRRTAFPVWLNLIKTDFI